MSQERDIRFSYSAIAEPYTAFFWGNRQFLSWAQKTGYSSAEYFPFRKAASEIISAQIDVALEACIVKSGHVRFNPYATVWRVLTRQKDPLRPRTPFGFYNLAFASPTTSIKSLQRLETSLGNNFSVVTYPHTMNGRSPYGEYNKPLLQTHPSVFKDSSTADDIIAQVGQGKYSGVVWDTYHALEEAHQGYAPLSNWRYSLSRFLEAGVLSEVHVQAGRTKERGHGVNDADWLRGMTGFNPDYNNELGQMIKMVAEANKATPLTIEVSLQAMTEAGLLKAPILSHHNLSEASKIHKELIDYVKRA